LENNNKGIVFTHTKSSSQFNLSLRKIPRTGILQRTNNNYVYLKIDDRFILELFPLLQHDNICLPPYFSVPYNIGAHISVVYKEEYQLKVNVQNVDNILFNFDVGGLYKAIVDQKKFLILKVISPSLENFRLINNLSKKPVYHGYQVDFHITIANINQLVFNNLCLDY